MSVPKSKRNLSQLEFYHTAFTLRKNLTELLLKDFSIKDKVRDIRSYVSTNRFEQADKEMFLQLCEKYKINEKIVEQYPEWLISHFRMNILNTLNDLINNITYANSVYPTREAEYDERRAFQNKAIANCYQLLQEMQYVISVVPVNAEKYMQHVDLIEKEIALLKGWRKSDNRILKAIRNKSGQPL